MPCQLAVSITKAVVTEAALRRLLTPQVLQTVVEPLLVRVYGSYAPSVQRTPIGLTCRVGPVTVAITQGTITLRTGARTALATQLVAQIESVLRETVTLLWTRVVCAALQPWGALSVQTVPMLDAGTVVSATVLTVGATAGSAAVVRVVLLPAGRLQVFVDGDVSFEDACLRTRSILVQVGVQGLPLQQIGMIEQHKEGVSHVHLVARVEQCDDSC